MLGSQGSTGGTAGNTLNKDEVDRTVIALKFKVASHQRTVGLAARVPRQREGMEDKVSLNYTLLLESSLIAALCPRRCSRLIKILNFAVASNPSNHCEEVPYHDHGNCMLSQDYAFPNVCAYM